MIGRRGEEFAFVAYAGAVVSHPGLRRINVKTTGIVRHLAMPGSDADLQCICQILPRGDGIMSDLQSLVIRDAKDAHTEMSASHWQ